MFERAIALDWYDGALSGLAVAPGLGHVSFQLIYASEDWNRRLFTLAPARAEAFDELVSRCEEFEKPILPLWWPYGSGEIVRQVSEEWFSEVAKLALPIGPCFAIALAPPSFPVDVDLIATAGAEDIERIGKLDGQPEAALADSLSLLVEKLLAKGSGP
jgi:hypothetical protein